MCCQVESYGAPALMEIITISKVIRVRSCCLSISQGIMIVINLLPLKNRPFQPTTDMGRL